MEANKKINVVPSGYTAVTPWVITPSTITMITFLEQVLDAREVPNSRITDDKGAIIHAVVTIGNAPVLLFDAREGWGATPAFLNFYVHDIEKALKAAVSLGAIQVTDITPLWFGEKVCRILDPFGNLFWLNERIEEIDFTDPKVGSRATTTEAVNGIAYIQQSLDQAFKKQKKMLVSI